MSPLKQVLTLQINFPRTPVLLVQYADDAHNVFKMEMVTRTVFADMPFVLQCLFPACGVLCAIGHKGQIVSTRSIV